MERLLIVGVDTTVGANIACTLADQDDASRISGIALNQPVQPDGCQVCADPGNSAAAIADCLEQLQPTQLVYCGPAARSSWEPLPELQSTPQIAAVTRHLQLWATAAREQFCRLTYISSDAVFTGPWMFHEEECPGECGSREAATLREWEQLAAAICPQTLVVRTNAYGWSPTGSGWLEAMISRLEDRSLTGCEAIRHSTPIPATDLADILARAWSEELTGTYHIAGAERVNPARFLRSLASELDLPFPLMTERETLLERPSTFAAGETSLHTRKIRKALCVAMPTLSEGLQRIREQQAQGWPQRLTGQMTPVAGYGNRAA